MTVKSQTSTFFTISLMQTITTKTSRTRKPFKVKSVCLKEHLLDLLMANGKVNRRTTNNNEE